jgi:16S rRNA G966 N2-methylase RsmD
VNHALIDAFNRDDVQAFLRLHEQDDVQEFMLKAKPVGGIAPALLAQQINGRQKARFKLPSWNRKGVVFPPTINMEQCSSEATARFKAHIIHAVSRKNAHGVDLTGGFGVDAWFLADGCSLDYVEPDEQLLGLAKHNHAMLGSKDISYHVATAQDFLHENQKPLDFIFIDPSRRKNGQKKFLLADCVPDILSMQEELLKAAPAVLIKTSPLFDLSRGCEQLRQVSGVFVVSLDNECRELLFLLQRGFEEEPTITCVDLLSRSGNIAQYTFRQSEERNAPAHYSDPLTYLYEPSAAILKGGAFKRIAQTHALSKLAPNSHLYTGHKLMEFQGRTFRILEAAKLDKSLVNKFPGGHANIITRNYPLRPEEIKKKTGLTDGGNLYLICTRGRENTFVLIAERI